MKADWGKKSRYKPSVAKDCRELPRGLQETRKHFPKNKNFRDFELLICRTVRVNF